MALQRVFIVTRSNYYPETREDAEAVWTEILSPAYATRASAKARVQAELDKDAAIFRDEIDNTGEADPLRDWFDVIEREVA